jgi:glutamyl-tRNA synthetase
LVQTRLNLLSEAQGMLGFLLVPDDALGVEEDALSSLKPDAPAVLDASITTLDGIAEWRTAELEAALRAALVDGLGIKPKFAFGPLRVAVTGRRVSPPLFESMEILGRDSTLNRLRSLRSALSAAPA